MIPLTRWYLQKERVYRRDGLQISVPPGVFHPGLFSSTGFLYRFLAEQDVKDKSLLELGCGTALLSIAASKAGAVVTASDLSKMAVAAAKTNALRNKAELNILQSDLFNDIHPCTFDWIVINPPYYPQDPVNEKELAWKCGARHDYYRKLFLQLPAYMDNKSFVLMVLTLGCDLEAIFSIANESSFRLELIREKPAFFDVKDFLYRIRKVT